MDFATVFTTFNLTEAQIVCSRLEAADFHPFVANENAASWLGGFGTFSSAGIVRVQVPEAEAGDAKEFLDAK
jgi:Putative prokaryotic signal transducing protein